MKRLRIVGLALALLMVLTTLTPVLALELSQVQPQVKCAYVPNVLSDGSNLRNDILDNGQYENDAYANLSLNFASGAVTITGTVGNKNLNVNAQYVSANENGNVYIYSGADTYNNFDVLYIAAEKDIGKSVLYFQSYRQQNSYNTVLKVYLREKGTSDFAVIEAFGIAFPNIIVPLSISEGNSQEACLAQAWYGKVFEPVEKNTHEIQTKAGNAARIVLESYSYSSYGVQITHYLRFQYDWDISDVTRNQSDTAVMGIEITAKFIEAPGYPNEESSSTSTLSLKDVELHIATPKNIAFQSQTVGDNDDTVWRDGGVTLSFSAGISVGHKGLSVAPSLSFTPYYSGNLARGLTTNVFTNTPGNYTRNGKTILSSPYSLNAIGNRLGVSYTMKDYGGSAQAGEMLLKWSYYLNNAMDYSQGTTKTKSVTVPVNIT